MVFSHEATKKLWDFANNPKNFIGQNLIPQNMNEKKIAINHNFSNVSSPVINVNIKNQLRN